MQQLDERFINLFTRDIEKRREYADEVWDILQKSYASVGGIKGSGFKDKEDMINNLPFWKLATKNGEVVAVGMFKDKNGRKRVAVGAKRAPGAKEKVVDMMLSDLKMKRSWGEVSGPSWGFLMKNVPEDIILQALIPIEKVRKLLPDDEIIPAFGNDPKIKSSDPFRDFWYMRTLGAAGGALKTKIAIGKPGNKIT